MGSGARRARASKAGFLALHSLPLSVCSARTVFRFCIDPPLPPTRRAALGGCILFLRTWTCTYLVEVEAGWRYCTAHEREKMKMTCVIHTMLLLVAARSAVALTSVEAAWWAQHAREMAAKRGVAQPAAPPRPVAAPPAYLDAAWWSGSRTWVT